MKIHWLALPILPLCAADFSLGIRDSLMIAHSFHSREFGPAQNLHGATYTCDVTFRARKLRPELNWVLDIGEASDLVATVLKQYHLQNLDELFPEENTTTEWMCAKIWANIAAAIPRDCGVHSLCVRLHESHKAWAEYEAGLEPIS